MSITHNIGSRRVFCDITSLPKRLPHYQEPSALILLRGHSLIEELLRGYLNDKLPNHAVFKHDQFPFSKVLMLCAALTPPAAESWGFEAAIKLNRAQNVIFHKFDSSKLLGELERFISFVEQFAKDSVFPPKERNEARLCMAIIDLHKELTNVFRNKIFGVQPYT
jgi:hypothetical protein